jgi:hypothetical protein
MLILICFYQIYEFIEEYNNGFYKITNKNHNKRIYKVI